jgi:hypothetical protein
MKTLIFCAVGDYENKSWLSKDSNVDFVLAYYGKSDVKFDRLKEISTYCFRSKGVKFQLLWSWWIHNREKTLEYDIIGVIDDDLQWDAEILNNFLVDMERHFNKNKESTVVYSPSHHKDGKISHDHMKQKFKEEFRESKHVEMTWPFFERNFLDSYLYNDYEISLQGWGEGALYSLKARNENKKMFIVDKYPSINPTNKQKGIKNNEMSGNYPYYSHIWEYVKKMKKIDL